MGKERCNNCLGKSCKLDDKGIERGPNRSQVRCSRCGAFIRRKNEK